jgi:hypothetical protein
MTIERMMMMMGAASDVASTDEVFSAYIYTGTAAAQTITNGIDLSGEGGMVWMKNRDGTDEPTLMDTERGIGTYLMSHSTNQASGSSNEYITSFNSDGFSLGYANQINRSGDSYVSWTFRKKEEFFDVVAYTGNEIAGHTEAHNLGVAPEMMIVKNRNSGFYGWAVYHKFNGNTKRMELDTVAGASTAISWNNTTPSATVFTLGDENGVNRSTYTYIAYLFASLDGISKVGSYTGNNSETTIDCGFSSGARFVMIKRTDSSGDWTIFDSTRGWASGTDYWLEANNNNTEASGNTLTSRSAGFGVRAPAYDAASLNVNGATYIYLAIA